VSEVEGVCAACGRPLEGTNWRWINARGYHAGCKPAPPAPERKRPTESLTAFAERKARNAMLGRGQQVLDDRGEDR
jgi:hypothetical protein